MKAQKAYDKTVELIKAYEKGDLLGGDPMCWIKAYGQQRQKKLIKKICKKLKKVNKELYPEHPVRLKSLKDILNFIDDMKEDIKTLIPYKEQEL